MIDAFLGRKQLERSIPCMAAAGFIVAALNWPHERVRVWFSDPMPTMGHGGLTSQMEMEVTERIAGWPISAPFVTNASPQWDVLVRAIIVDGMVALAVCLTVGVLATAYSLVNGARSTTTTTTSTGQPPRWTFNGLSQRFSYHWVAGLGAVTCLGLVLVGLFAQGLLAERKLEAALTRHGRVSRAAEMPGFVARRLPSWAVVPFARMETVSVYAAPSELIEQALTLPTLRSLTIRNQTVGSTLWSRITHGSSLETLRLVNCQWQAGSVPAATQASQDSKLRSLSIDRCDGSSYAELLGQFPNLQTLGLTHSPLPKGASIIEFLPKNLKDLCLTVAADVASIKLAKLDQLETIALQSAHEPTSQAVVLVELTDLARLKYVAFPATMRLDFAAKNLPSLQQLSVSASHHAWFTDNDMSSPLRVRKLTIDGAPCLQELQLSGDDLRSLAVASTPNLRSLSIEQPRRFPREHGTARPRHTSSVVVDHANEWIRDLATCDGPISLKLSTLALAGVDLVPLSQNRRIKELVLANTGVQASQLTGIKHDGRIRSLNLKGCDINAKEFSLILANYPGIQQLHVDTHRFETLEIVDQPHLIHLFSTPTRSARKVRIVGCPKLTGTLTLGNRLEQLEVRDAQSLKGLVVNGWLPENTVLTGLRDLEVVELAGRNVSEQHLSELENCRQLGELTLIMPSISTSRLMDIGKFSELMVLKLPGAKLNDEVTARWGSLHQLREIDFSHTQVTAKSIQPFLECGNLQRVNLAHTSTVAAELDQLANLKSLIEVDLAGVGITPQHLKRCLAERFIDRINLSGTSLNAEMINVLASEQARRLLFVGLKDCRLTDDDVLRIATAHPEMAMDIDGNLISSDTVRQLSAQGRLIACSDRVGFDNWIQHLSTGQPLTTPPRSKRFVRAVPSESSRSAWASSGRSGSANRSDRNQFKVPSWVRRGIENWNVQ